MQRNTKANFFRRSAASKFGLTLPNVEAYITELNGRVRSVTV